MSKVYPGITWLAFSAVLFFTPQRTVSAQDANRTEVIIKTDLGDVVQRVAKRSGEFKEEFSKAVEHSLVDGTRVEGRLKHRADELHDAAKKLQDVFHDKRDKNNPAVREQVDKTLAVASDLNHVMESHRFTEKIQADWGLLHADLNALAAVYDLSPL